MKSARRSATKKGAGEHHHVNVKLSAAGPDGVLDFFSDGFAFHLALKKGKISGSAIVSGRDFATKLQVSPKNLWKLEYIHEKDDRTMSVYTNFGAITKSTDLFGVSHADKTHDIQLAFSERLGIHGYVASTSKHLDFGLRFTKRGAASVELAHSGAQHELKAKYHSDGNYELKLRIDVGGGTLTLSKKKKQLEAEAQFSF